MPLRRYGHAFADNRLEDIATSNLRHILIVDVGRQWRLLYLRELQDAGYAPTVVDAVDALRHLDRQEPDAIVISVASAAAGGWTLIQRLKANPLKRHIPIVVLLNHLDPPVPLSLLTILGCAEVLSGQCSAPDLIGVLRLVGTDGAWVGRPDARG